MKGAAAISRSRLSGQTVLLAAVMVASCAVVGYLLAFHNADAAGRRGADDQSDLSLSDIPFDGTRAYGYLTDLCNLGPRPSDSPGMSAQQKLLIDHFRKLGAKVFQQKFRLRHPADGHAMTMTNLIVEWNPQARERILLCTHYDTRPFPDQDRANPRGKFVGANDGASGTALLMALAHDMPALKGKLGVDFVLFDGEEFVFDEARDPYFLGAEYFATEYANNQNQSKVRYRWGVLLDMVADADLQIYPDRHSLTWDDTRPLVEEIWNTAKRLKVREFVSNRRFDVNDDHVRLHDIGGISCCDIIDFKYPAWHTQGDLPDRCSALSLAKVGWVISEWLKQAVKR